MKELDLSLYGLGQNDEPESLQGLLHGDSTSIKTLSDVRSYLSTVYCGSMAVDFSGIEVNLFMKHPPFLVNFYIPKYLVSTLANYMYELDLF